VKKQFLANAATGIQGQKGFCFIDNNYLEVFLLNGFFEWFNSGDKDWRTANY
jgi:hypothetical protein